MTDTSHPRPRPDLAPGDRVTTDFHRRESVRVRVVAAVTRAPYRSQSGWFVRTECGLYCDAGWFEKADEPGPPRRAGVS